MTLMHRLLKLLLCGSVLSSHYIGLVILRIQDILGINSCMYRSVLLWHLGLVLDWRRELARRQNFLLGMNGFIFFLESYPILHSRLPVFCYSDNYDFLLGTYWSKVCLSTICLSLFWFSSTSKCHICIRCHTFNLIYLAAQVNAIILYICRARGCQF